MPVHLLIPRLIAAAAASAALAGAASPLPDGIYAEITTPRGSFTCQLAYERVPLVVASFVGLAEGTLGPAPRKPFFDGLTFHRVVPHFVIQGGDPLGTGEGGPGYSFPDQFAPGLSHDDVGILSMANDGPDTNGSQFFLTLVPLERLDFLHAVFGKTVRGAGVLSRVVQGDVMHVRILRIGEAARNFRADDAAFAALVAATPKFTAPRQPGPRAHFDDPDHLLPSEPPRAVAFNYKLANVERATGVRIYGRVYALFIPGAPGETPAAFADRQARELGIAEDGALAILFADRNEWILWFGPSIRHGPMEVGPPGSRQRAAFEASIRGSAKMRESRYRAAGSAILPNFLQVPGQRIKVSVDAMLDEIIGKLAL